MRGRWTLQATALLLPLAVACSGEAEAEGNGSVDVGNEHQTVPRLVDSFKPDPSMFFGESEEEQQRARAALREIFPEGEVFPEGASRDEGTVAKGVNTSACLDFSVPPFTGPGGVELFFNTLPQGGLTPTSVCGPRTIGESRLVAIENFTEISRSGSGIISVGVRNASVEECADLNVALAVAEQRGPNQSTRILFSSGNEEAQLQQINGVAVCASYVPMFGSFEAERFDGKDLWIAVQANLNRDGNSLAFAQLINDRVHLIRKSDL
ncbi:MAG: hypothetical protein RL033_2226 [Pseudomonadota bacterium]